MHGDEPVSSAPGTTSVDPFLLPSETDARFTLLIVAVVGASVLLYTLLFNSIGPFWDFKTATQTSCLNAATRFVPAETIAASVERSRLAYECQRPLLLLQLGWELGGAGALLALTFGLYWWLPVRTLRRAGFRPLTAAEAPDLVAAIHALSKEAGLSRPPNLVWSPLNRSTGGVAFGHWGRRYLGLYGGTYLRFRRNPDMFRAVVLHELAHIRNGDVDKAGLAVTVWWAFLAVCLVPAVLGMLLDGKFTAFTPIAFGWRLAALAGLVVLTRAAVLRERELYADQRAVEWSPSSDAVAQAVGSLEGRATTNPRWRFPALLSRPLALHPGVGERLVTLRESAGLFRTDYWAAFGAGVAATLALQSVELLLSNVLPQEGELTSALAALVFAPFAVGVIALSIWRRQAYWVLARTRVDAHSPTRLGLAFGAGLYVGWHLSLASYALDTSTAVIVGTQRLVFEIAFASFVLGSMALFVKWLQVCADAWIAAVRLAGRPLRFALLASVVIAGLVLVFWMEFTNYALNAGLVGLQGLMTTNVESQMAEFGIPVHLSPEMAVLVQVFGLALLFSTFSPVTAIGLALLWAFPLAAARIRELRHPGEPGVRLLAILIWALAAGLVSVPLSVALFLLGDGNSFKAVIAGLLVAAVCPAVAGVMVARRADRLGILQGLCTAQLAILVAVALVVGVASLFGIDVPSLLWLSMLNGGTIVAAIPILSLGLPLFTRTRAPAQVRELVVTN